MTAEPTAGTAGPNGPEPTPAERAATSRRRQQAFLWTLVLVALAALAAVAVRRGDDPPPADIPLDAWAPYWALDVSLDELASRSGMLRELSPFGYRVTGPETIELEAPASPERVAALERAARRAGLAVVPSLTDGLPAGSMAAILADPTSRSRHIDAVVDFVVRGGYDGIDINYEQFAFVDDRTTWATTRPAWVAFIVELRRRLGERLLVVSVPPVYDAGRTDTSGYWVYDYGAIAPHVDRIRVMAYDYSFTTPGPIAPLDWVEQVVEGAIEATGSPDRLVLGIPVYGYNWVLSTTGTCPADAPGRTTVTLRSVDDLMARRSVTPVFDEVTGESTFTYQLVVDDGTTSCEQLRRAHYVDAVGARLRLDLARRAGFAGGVLWALGYDDAAVWDALGSIVRPRSTG